LIIFDKSYAAVVLLTPSRASLRLVISVEESSIKQSNIYTVTLQSRWSSIILKIKIVIPGA
jgi:hypothetical protein